MPKKLTAYEQETIINEAEDMTLSAWAPQLEESQPKQSTAIRWSAGGVIQYLDGWGWGVDQELNTICLGSESVVKEAIANPKLKCSDPYIDQIIELERQLMQKESELNGRQPEIKRPGAFRSRPVRTIKYREANTRRTSTGKRVAVYKT